MMNTFKGPTWAFGCDNCEFGLIGPPPIPPTMNALRFVRLGQALRGELRFCHCRAGQAYAKFLGRLKVDDPTEMEPPQPYRITADDRVMEEVYA